LEGFVLHFNLDSLILNILTNKTENQFFTEDELNEYHPEISKIKSLLGVPCICRDLNDNLKGEKGRDE